MSQTTHKDRGEAGEGGSLANKIIPKLYNRCHVCECRCNGLGSCPIKLKMVNKLWDGIV